MTRYILHVTLTSGHERQSPRSEVGDDVVHALTPLVDRALAGYEVPVPGQPGYTMRAIRWGACCLVTLYGVVPDTVGPEWVPILTTGVALHSRCGARLWRMLHGGTHALATHPERCPPEPWCADRLEAGTAMHPDALEWTGDWSRCLAWTWAEMLT